MNGVVLRLTIPGAIFLGCLGCGTSGDAEYANRMQEATP